MGDTPDNGHVETEKDDNKEEENVISEGVMDEGVIGEEVTHEVGVMDEGVMGVGVMGEGVTGEVMSEGVLGEGEETPVAAQELRRQSVESEGGGSEEDSGSELLKLFVAVPASGSDTDGEDQ